MVTFLGGTLYIYIYYSRIHTHTPKEEKTKGHVHFTITITRDKNGPLYNVIVFSFIIPFYRTIFQLCFRYYYALSFIYTYLLYTEKKKKTQKYEKKVIKVF